MKNKTFNHAVKACLFSVTISGASLAMASDASNEESSDFFYSSAFDSCFKDGYNIAELNEKQIFSTAQCFDGLLTGNEVNPGASRHTIMAYAVNWYEAAAEKGHQGARKAAKANLLALNALENQTATQLSEATTLLASEQDFNALDMNGDGLLSVAEASVSESLKSQFEKADIDRDGLISVGEYTINSGEATAAGQP